MPLAQLPHHPGPLLLAAAAIALLAITGTLTVLDRLWPPPTGAALEYSVQVLADDGRILRLYTTPDGYWRLPVNLEAIDPRFVERLIAVEDQRFHGHPGVDPLALARAVVQAVRQGRVVSGGSTLSMQVVRLLEPRPRRVSSKLIELFRAWQIERRLSKDEILALYLTLAPYGGNLQGLPAASLFYFGKAPRFLTLEETALLIALPQAPEARRPDRNPQHATAARDRLLRGWAADDRIDAPSLQAALRAPVPESRLPAPRHAPHLADRLRGHADARGRVTTFLDAELQQRLERRLAREQLQLAQGQTSAALVVEHGTGRVRAWVGSGDYFGQGFPGQVDMVSALRSPGSLLKPLIYGLAFDQDVAHPQTLVVDRATPRQAWSPRNFDRLEQGEMTLAEALMQSRNIPAVRVLDRVGPDRLLASLHELGVAAVIPGSRRPGLAVGLGGIGLDMRDIATLYGAIGQQGIGLRPQVSTGDGAADGARLLSGSAAWQVARILLETALPEARWGSGRPIALKTGTSFGYRDAWAVGVDDTHTAIVWVGRPDGGYTAGLTGLTAAVPLLLDVFTLLPDADPHWPGPPPDGTLLARTGDLPTHLQRLEARDRLSAPPAPGPRFAFPADATTLAWNPAEPEILLDVRGGQPPLNWLVDGRPTRIAAQGRQHLWRPERPGAYRVTALDARGRAASVRIDLRTNAGSPGYPDTMDRGTPLGVRRPDGEAQRW
ncbi:Multimodular transpeptidase-transglycosylase [Thioalkalivibrio nitratireducens DSM 14787]|uniref:peptidoglycan glycosyltransferase n=1 Tax=Thioalkalivibrio nitratireducens (strain DSM 14787 / UNIQEM 213 / ALEN2) TaxID=1255043 RepID=L0DY38_THIND|nr:penicillin-binding protein 1C [Thioalkalivibrio nitratireducens]AGA33296.1 Multimodular transpeptidase-transglycosylase [Thioalkalivibrio nitratireducens DSM 14787]